MNQWVIFYLLVVPLLIWSFSPESPAWMRILRLLGAVVLCFALMNYALQAPIPAAQVVISWGMVALPIWLSAICYVGLWDMAWEGFYRACGRAPEAGLATLLSTGIIATAWGIFLFVMVETLVFNEKDLPVAVHLIFPWAR